MGRRFADFRSNNSTATNSTGSWDSLGETNFIAARSKEINLFDAETGRPLGAMPLPAENPLNDLWPQSLRHGVFLCQGRRNEKGAVDDHRLFSIDPLGKVWTPLSSGPIYEIAIHPEQPWAAFTWRDESLRADRMSVVDYRNGREVSSINAEVRGPPRFLVNPEALAVRVTWTRTQSGGIVSSPGLGLFRIADGSAIDVCESVDLRRFNWSHMAAQNGRVLLEGWRLQKIDGEDVWCDVYDMLAGRYYSSLPFDQCRSENSGKQQITNSISPLGGAVLRGDPPGVYEIGTGRALWKAGPHERFYRAWLHRPDFFVYEEWHKLWEHWLPTFKYKTAARRSFETGALIERVGADVWEHPLHFVNQGETLTVLIGGAVHRLPFAANYPLLALCQTILAMPLVLLWAALIWRRRRRLRAMLAAPLSD